MIENVVKQPQELLMAYHHYCVDIVLSTNLKPQWHYIYLHIAIICLNLNDPNLLTSIKFSSFDSMDGS